MKDLMAMLVLEANRNPSPEAIQRMLDEAAWCGARITIVTRGVPFDLATMGVSGSEIVTRRVRGSMTAADVADLLAFAEAEASRLETPGYLTSVHFEHALMDYCPFLPGLALERLD